MMTEVEVKEEPEDFTEESPSITHDYQLITRINVDEIKSEESEGDDDDDEYIPPTSAVDDEEASSNIVFSSNNDSAGASVSKDKQEKAVATKRKSTDANALISRRAAAQKRYRERLRLKKLEAQTEGLNDGVCKDKQGVAKVKQLKSKDASVLSRRAATQKRYREKLRLRRLEAEIEGPTLDEQKKRQEYLQRRRESYQRKVMRKLEAEATMTEEELNAKKFEKYFMNQANRARRSKEQLEKRRVKQRIQHQNLPKEIRVQKYERFKNWRQNLNSEKRERNLESLRRSYHKRMEALRKDPEKYKEYWRKKMAYEKERLKRVRCSEGDNVGAEETEEENKRKKRNRERGRLTMRKILLKKRLMVQKGLEEGLSLEEITHLRESPEVREKRLQRLRKDASRRELRAKLVRNGVSPEELQNRMAHFEVSYKPTSNAFKVYKPKLQSLKPLDQSELELLTRGKVPLESLLESISASLEKEDMLNPTNIKLEQVAEPSSCTNVPPPPRPSTSTSSLNYQENDDDEMDHWDEAASPASPQDFHEEGSPPQSPDFQPPEDDVQHSETEDIHNDSQLPCISTPAAPIPITNVDNLPTPLKTAVPAPQSGKQVRICETCGVAFPTRSLANHRLSHHHPYYDHTKKCCTLCNEVIPSPTSFYFRHWLKVHKNVTKNKELKFVCELCGAQFAGEQGLSLHVRYKHNSFTKVKCPHPSCGKEYQHQATLNAHIRAEHDDEGVSLSINRSFKCKRCPSCFGKSEELKAHVQTLHPESFFPCFFCGVLKYTEGALKFHPRDCKNRPKDAVLAQKDSLDKITVTCEICLKKMTLSGLKRHYKDVHGIIEQEFKCQKCHKMFKTREYLVAHVEMEHDIKTKEIIVELSKYNVMDRSKIIVKQWIKPGRKPRGPYKQKQKGVIDDEEEKEFVREEVVGKRRTRAQFKADSAKQKVMISDANNIEKEKRLVISITRLSSKDISKKWAGASAKPNEEGKDVEPVPFVKVEETNGNT